jgi:hypothetical protein
VKALTGIIAVIAIIMAGDTTAMLVAGVIIAGLMMSAQHAMPGRRRTVAVEEAETGATAERSESADGVEDQPRREIPWRTE